MVLSSGRRIVLFTVSPMRFGESAVIKAIYIYIYHLGVTVREAHKLAQNLQELLGSSLLVLMFGAIAICGFKTFIVLRRTLTSPKLVQKCSLTQQNPSWCSLVREGRCYALAFLTSTQRCPVPRQLIQASKQLSGTNREGQRFIIPTKLPY